MDRVRRGQTTLSCHHEPSLPDIAVALDHLGDFRPDVIIALGGGSVIDFAKALAALIPCEGEASEYLEVVGSGCGRRALTDRTRLTGLQQSA